MNRILFSAYRRTSPPAFLSNIPSNPSSPALTAAKSGIPSSRVLQSFRLLSNVPSPATISPYKENAQLCLLQLSSLPPKSERNPFFYCAAKRENRRKLKDSFFLCSNDRELRVHKPLHFPYEVNYGFQALASCNGLVILMRGKHNSRSCPRSLILWNPVIRKSLIIDEHQYLTALEAIGLGFDSRTGDYKVLTIREELGNETTLVVNLYSLKANSWKQLPDVDAILANWINVHRAMTYLNGHLYFVATRRRSSGSTMCLVMGFDLSNEVFHEILLPNHLAQLDICCWGNCQLWTYGESLAVSIFGDDISVIEIWVMKEHGAKRSWTLLSTARLEGLHEQRYLVLSGLVFTNDDHVVLSVGSYYGDKVVRIFSHDLKSHETKEIMNDDDHSCFFLGGFVESQALMDKGDDLSSSHFEIDSYEADDISGDSPSKNSDILTGTSN